MRLLPLLLAAFTLLAGPAMAEPLRITDITGREVELPGPASRVVLGQGRHLVALGMLHEDPLRLLVGWKDDLSLDPALWGLWAERFPGLRELPLVGGALREEFSVESVIALDPDLVVLSAWSAGDPGLTGRSQVIDLLEAAGIPVLVIDFFVSPLANTEASLRILGAATGAEARAAEIAEAYALRRERLEAAVAGRERPEVMIHVHATPDPCCTILGRGVFADMVAVAGGQTDPELFALSPRLELSLEGMLTMDPDLYIATGGLHLAGRGGAVLGIGVSPDEAEASFCALLETPGISGIPAVERGEAMAFWHMFNDSPLHVILLEHLANRFHPGLIEAAEIARTEALFLQEFPAVRLSGTFWAECARE